MPRWPLLLPPPAVSTLPSRSRLPHRPSSSSHHRAVPRRRVAVAPSTAIAPHRPSPSIHHHDVHHRPSVVLSVYRRRTRAVPCHRGAITPSMAAEEPSCRRGAVAPSITVKDRCCIAPSPSTCPSQSSRSSPHWRRHRPASDDSCPRRQPLPPPLLVLLAPAALLAPLRAFALADHPHLSPPALIEATAPPLLSSP